MFFINKNDQETQQEFYKMLCGYAIKYTKYKVEFLRATPPFSLISSIEIIFEKHELKFADFMDLCSTHQEFIIYIEDINEEHPESKKLKNMEQNYELCLEYVSRDGLALKYVGYSGYYDNIDNLCRAAIKNNYKAIQYSKNNWCDDSAMMESPNAIFYIKKPSYKNIKYAVKKLSNGIIVHPNIRSCPEKMRRILVVAPEAIKFVENQTISLCLTAVKHKGTVLQYIREQTLEICAAAIEKDYRALEYVHDQTPDLCKKAIEKNYRAFSFVREKTEEISLFAVEKNGYLLSCIANPSFDMCLAAVKSNAKAIKYMKNQPPELQLIAVKQDPFAIKYINDPTPEVCLEAIEEDENTLKYIKNNYQTEQLCIKAIRQNWRVLRYVRVQTMTICKEAINCNGKALKYIIEQTPDLCRKAIAKDAYAAKYALYK